MKRTQLGRLREKLKKRAQAERAAHAMQLGLLAAQFKLQLDAITMNYEIGSLARAFSILKSDTEEQRLP